MKHQTLGDKADFASRQIRNGEASATIPRGAPVVMALSGTEDGLRVLLPSTAGAVKSMLFFFGVSMDSYAVGALGEAQAAGFCRYAKLLRQARTSSTVSWASEDTLATGLFLALNSVHDAFTTIASTLSVPATDSTALSLNQYYAYLAESLASYAGSASSTSDTRLALTSAVKIFLRAL